jgi:hypothetical protein
MTMQFPDDLLYTASHEWVRREADGTVTVGISDLAQDSLGELVYVELPAVGRSLAAAESCAVVESTKAASDVYAPLAAVGQFFALCRRLAVSHAPGRQRNARLAHDIGTLPGRSRPALTHRAATMHAHDLIDDIAGLFGNDEFHARHIGPGHAEEGEMLARIGATSRDELIRQTVPAAILRDAPLNLPEPATEADALTELRALAAGNQVWRSFIGMGYHGTFTPEPIRRNVLENPGGPDEFPADGGGPDRHAYIQRIAAG